MNKILFFNKEKPIIGMLHLEFLEGKNYKGVNFVVKKALKDINALQSGGVDGILIENWKADFRSEFASQELKTNFLKVVKKLEKHLKVPFGINILTNDYKLALTATKKTGGSFVQLDMFVDKVKTDFSYDKGIASEPFTVNPKPKEIYKTAGKIPLFVFIQPKHTIMLEKNKTIEKSAKQAVKNGASAIIITKATGQAPTLNLIKKTKKVAKDVPVGIGSGLSYDNVEEFFPIIDFAIVGSYFKKDGITDNPVDPKRVKKFMKKIELLRKKL